MAELHKNYNGKNPVKLKEKICSLEKELEDMRLGMNKTNVEIKILYKELEKWNKELEQRVEKRTNELKKSQIQLIHSEKLSALGELAACIIHELNQPLNVIKIITQSILRDIEKSRFDEESAKKDLPEITEQMDRMVEIIDHMRIFTRRSTENPKEKIELNSVVEDTLKFVGHMLKDHNVEVVKELSPGLPPIEGEPVRLEQVFLNFINNARYAVKESGKEKMKIVLKTYSMDGGKQVVVEVKDNGIGISEDMKDKIFEPFFTTKESGRGTGLGLAVSNKIVEEHKGKIEVDSNLEEGTTFRVILPAV